MNHVHNLTDEEKETITEWVEDNAEFERGDLVTVDYDGTGIAFANSEYGGIPLRVKEPVWRNVQQVSASSLHHYFEEEDTDEIFQLYEEEDAPDHAEESGWTPYVKPEIAYSLEVAVNSRAECGRSVEQAALVRWEDFEGDLTLVPRGDRSRVSLREGSECRVCGFSSEIVSESSLPDGSRYGRTECASCGYVKEENAP